MYAVYYSIQKYLLSHSNKSYIQRLMFLNKGKIKSRLCIGLDVLIKVFNIVYYYVGNI